MSSVISAGDAAPKVHLETTGGKVSIPSDSGRGLILFFYPKDNTPGCTNEAKDFTALKDEFDKKGFDIIGISRDSLASHEKFIAKQELGFPLATDEDGSVCEAFGVWKEKNMYGRKFMGIERSTFAISADGMIIESWRKVRVKGHAEEVLSVL
jgi:thioredoxin-dependent peroxiredoxin